MIRTGWMRAAVAISAIGQSVSVIVLVITALGLRHDGTVGTRPTRSTFATELLLLLLTMGYHFLTSL